MSKMKKALMAACLMATPLAAETKVFAFAGSTRTDSYNKKLVKEAAELARQMGHEVTVVNLENYRMPLYEAELEQKKGMPKNAKLFRDQILKSHVILIASPEYNASIPGLLKNVIDWISRSEDGKGSREAFKNKQFVIMSASQGPGGGARGLKHLRTIIEAEGGEVIELEVTVANAQNAFDEQGKLKDPAIREKLQAQLSQVTAG